MSSGTELPKMNNYTTDKVIISREALIVCTILDILGFVTGTICNCLVVITIGMTKKLFTSSINRAVLNLCLADLCVILIDVPLTTIILIGNHIHYTPWSEDLCHIQSFCHTLSNSVQVLVFPVIGIERWYSISSPFKTTKNLERVNCLNSFSWVLGLMLAMISVFIFPSSTSVSIYCTKTRISELQVGSIFNNIYFITFPLGMAAIIITVMCYIGIVYLVRQQNKTSTAANRGKKSIRHQNPKISAPPNSPTKSSNTLPTMDIGSTLELSWLVTSPWRFKYSSMKKTSSFMLHKLPNIKRSTRLKLKLDKSRIDELKPPLNNEHSTSISDVKQTTLHTVPTLSVLVEEPVEPEKRLHDNDIIQVEVHSHDDEAQENEVDNDKVWQSVVNSNDFVGNKDYLSLPPEKFYFRKRYDSACDSSRYGSSASSICDSISMTSLNEITIADDMSINEYPISREMTPLPMITFPPMSPLYFPEIQLITPPVMSPLHVPKVQRIPEIVITLTEDEEQPVDEQISIPYKPNREIQDNNESVTVVALESPENCNSVVDIEGEILDKVSFANEGYSNSLGNENLTITAEDINREERTAEVENRENGCCSNQLDDLSEEHKLTEQTKQTFCDEEKFKKSYIENFDGTALKHKESLKAKVAGHLSKRRTSIISQLSSHVAIHDPHGNVLIYNKHHLPRSIRASKGAICLRDPKSRMRVRQRIEAKTAKRSSYIVLLFLLLWLPLPVAVALNFYYVSNGNHQEKTQLFLDLQVCAFCFGTLSATANPIIYGLAIKKFRKAFSKLAKRHKNRILKR